MSEKDVVIMNKKDIVENIHTIGFNLFKLTDEFINSDRDDEKTAEYILGVQLVNIQLISLEQSLKNGDE